MSSIAYVNLVMSLNHEIVRDRVTFLRSKGEPTALHEFAEALDKTIAAALAARVVELEAENARLRRWLHRIEGGDKPCHDEVQLRHWAYEAACLNHEFEENP